METELITWLKDGRYRIKTLQLLSKKPLLSSELAEELHINRASMSRVLRDLETKELVLAISGKSRTVTYIIEKKGKEILEYWERS
ncbi:hypothetical protein ES705_31860 [subsurface metagenome]